MISISRILCPIDFSDTSRRAVACAAALARWYEARLIALHVVVEVPVVEAAPGIGSGVVMPPVVLKDVDRDALRATMRSFATPAAGDVPVDLELREAADVREEILRSVAALEADLVVMGSHGRSGVRHLLLGSVADAVLRRAASPVLIVPPHADATHVTVPFKQIVCPVDFSPTSLFAVEFAMTLAQEDDAEVTLVHSIDMSPELLDYEFPASFDFSAMNAAARADALRRLRELVPESAREYCTVHTESVEGRPHRAIVQLAAERKADLIVMGAHGRSAIDRLVFGSNTYAVIRDAACPVLAVHPPQA